MTTALDDRTPQEIERSISATRESLKGKLNELEHRLSPSERMRDVTRRINPDAVLPWAAVGAVATGAMLAVRGLRRHHHAPDGDTPADDPQASDAICVVEVEVPPGVVA